MTDTLLPKNEDTELREAILEFDKSRGLTGADYVLGKITRQQADSEFEDDIAKLIAAAHARDTKMLEQARVEGAKHLFDSLHKSSLKMTDEQCKHARKIINGLLNGESK